MLGVISSSIIQVLICMFVPFLFFVIKYRTQKGFTQYIGLYKPERKTMFAVICITPVILVLNYGVIFMLRIQDTLTSSGTTLGKILLLDTLALQVFATFIFAFVQTALAEEIFFRGFIGKRMINRFGFAVGNTGQAVLFGLVHGGLILIPAANTSFWFVIFLIFSTTITGYLLGYIKEKKGNGSVIPGWVAHGLMNCVAWLAILITKHI